MISVVRLLLPHEGRPIIAVAVAFAAGCNFTPPRAAPTDGEPGTDGPGPDVVEPTCLARWRDGTVTLGAPTRLDQLGSPQVDRDPHVSSDGLTIYFSTYRSGALSGDVYAATRASTSEEFGAPARRDDLSSASDDSRFSTTSDGRVGIVSSTRPVSEGSTDLWITSRASGEGSFGTFDKMGLDIVNTAGAELDPELSADGQSIYLAIGDPQRIAVSRRGTDGTFGAPQQIDELFSTGGDADPSLSPDELVIVFGSRRGPNPGDLWYSARADKAAAFRPPVALVTVNSDLPDGDPSLSADGCRLYFASLRTGDWELFVAEVTP